MVASQLTLLQPRDDGKSHPIGVGIFVHVASSWLTLVTDADGRTDYFGFPWSATVTQFLNVIVDVTHDSKRGSGAKCVERGFERVPMAPIPSLRPLTPTMHSSNTSLLSSFIDVASAVVSEEALY